MVLCQLAKTSCENEEGLIIRRKRGGSHGSSTREGEENPDCAFARWDVGWSGGWNCVSISSLNNLVNHFPSQLCQPLISTEMWIREEILVKPQLVQDRRVYVAKVIWAFDSTKSNRVG